MQHSTCIKLMNLRKNQVQPTEGKLSNSFITTYADPTALAEAVNDSFVTYHPKSKVVLHPLNSQKKESIGYLQYSSSNINLQDLQYHITTHTGIPVLAQFDNLVHFLDPTIPPNKSKRHDIVTLYVLPKDTPTMIDKLSDTFPIDSNYHQSEYITGRKMLFISRQTILNTEIDALREHTQEQIENATNETCKVTNIFFPLNTQIFVPDQETDTDLRTILATLSLPVLPGQPHTGTVKPKALFRSAEPNRDRNQPETSIVLTFQADDRLKVSALLQNLDLAIKQIYGEEHYTDILDQILIRGAKNYRRNPTSLHKFYQPANITPPSAPNHLYVPPPTGAQLSTNNTNVTNDTTTSASTRPLSPPPSPDKKKARGQPHVVIDLSTTDPTNTAQPTVVMLNPTRQLSFDPQHHAPYAQTQQPQINSIRTHQVITSQPTDLQHLQSFPPPNQNELTALLYHLSMNAQRQEQQVEQMYQEQLHANTQQRIFNEQFMAYMTQNDKRNEETAAIHRDTTILQTQLLNKIFNQQPPPSETTRTSAKRSLPMSDPSTASPPNRPSKND